MTREEAIKILRSLYNVQRLDTLTQEEMTAVAIAIKALEQTRWIPISEKLPKKDGCYLVTTTGTNNDIIDISYYDSVWHKASRIIAWMPLPQPYKGESEDKK